jgi:hypothetical protein
MKKLFNIERIATQCICCASEKLRSSPAVLMPFIAHRAFGWKPIEIDDSWGLITIKNGNAYSICNSLFCDNCFLLFLDIRFNEIEILKLYKDYRGIDYTKLRDFYEPGYSERNKTLNYNIDYMETIENFLEPHVKVPLTILDWGGDTGRNTPFNKNNIEFDIFDISNKKVMNGAKKINKSEASKKKYRLIVCRGVLEHVPFPMQLLYDIKKSMNKDSILYIQVPLEDLVYKNEKNYYLRKKHWHEHINFFSEKSLKQLTGNVGLEIIALKKLKVKNNGSIQPSYEFLVACKKINKLQGILIEDKCFRINK